MYGRGAAVVLRPRSAAQLQLACWRLDSSVRQLPLASRAFLVKRDLHVLYRHDLAVAHLAISPVEEAHGLPQIHVRAQGDVPSRIGQQALDIGARLDAALGWRG